jgi:monofunctional chorismate mutase
VKESKLNSIEELRKEVDSLDIQIIQLMEKRLSISSQIGKIKQDLNLPTYTPEREEVIKNRISELVEDEKKKNRILKIYESILNESRAVQNEYGEEE